MEGMKWPSVISIHTSFVVVGSTYYRRIVEAKECRKSEEIRKNRRYLLSICKYGSLIVSIIFPHNLANFLKKLIRGYKWVWSEVKWMGITRGTNEIKVFWKVLKKIIKEKFLKLYKKKPKWKAEFVGTSHHQPRTVREVAIRLSRQVEGTGLRTVDLGERWHGHCLLRGCHHQVLAAQVNREKGLFWNEICKMEEDRIATFFFWKLQLHCSCSCFLASLIEDRFGMEKFYVVKQISIFSSYHK